MPALQYVLVFCFCSLIENFDNVDKSIFVFFNQFHHHLVDYVMFAISHKFLWIPLYIALFVILIKHFRWQVLKILLIVGIAITLSDQISSSLIKSAVARYRPCHNIDLKDKVHTFKGKCGGIYGFVSSHAANSAALAVIIVFFLRKRVKYIYWYAGAYVVLISYSRIYLGVHYPGDIIGGIITGCLVSWLILLIYQWLSKAFKFIHIAGS